MSAWTSSNLRSAGVSSKSRAVTRIFKFVHADVFNLVYNPEGKIAARNYRFPFQPRTFTFCLATSLFTHLLPDVVEQYLHEAARILSPGGTFLATWFLLCEETKTAMAQGRSSFTFPHTFQHHAQHSTHAPEQAVAFELEYLRALYDSSGFEISAVHLGGWSGYAQPVDSGQDLIVAKRKST